MSNFQNVAFSGRILTPSAPRWTNDWVVGGGTMQNVYNEETSGVVIIQNQQQ